MPVCRRWWQALMEGALGGITRCAVLFGRASPNDNHMCHAVKSTYSRNTVKSKHGEKCERVFPMHRVRSESCCHRAPSLWPARSSAKTTVTHFGTDSGINVLVLAQTGDIKQAGRETAIAQAVSLQLCHSRRSEPAASRRAALWYAADSDKLPIGKRRMDGDLVTHHSASLNPSSRVLQMQEGPLMYVFRRARMKKLLKSL